MINNTIHTYINSNFENAFKLINNLYSFNLIMIDDINILKEPKIKNLLDNKSILFMYIKEDLNIKTIRILK